jgi:DNA-binding MarR family transcriptional regulator
MIPSGVRQRAVYLARIIPEMNKRIRARISPQPAILESGLTITQVQVLYFLRDRGPAAMTDLAEWTGVSLPTMTVTVQRLAKSGRVGRLRDALDRRVVKASITPQGLKECAAYEADMRKNLEALLQTLKVEDQLRLEKAFMDLADIFIERDAAVTKSKPGRRARA